MIPMKLVPRKKVEIVVDAIAEQDVVTLVERAGATGYTVVPNVGGRGHRGIRVGHDIFDPAPNVLVIVVCAEAIADRIVEDAMRLLERRAGILTVTDVGVARGELF